MYSGAVSVSGLFSSLTPGGVRTAVEESLATLHGLSEVKGRALSRERSAIIGGGKLQMEPRKSTGGWNRNGGWIEVRKREEDWWYLKAVKKRKGKAARILNFWFGVTASFST